MSFSSCMIPSDSDSYDSLAEADLNLNASSVQPRTNKHNPKAMLSKPKEKPVHQLGNRSVLALSQTPKKRYSAFDIRQNGSIVHHQAIIDSLELKMQELIDTASADDLEKNIEVLRVYELKLTELESQLTVYQSLKARAIKQIRNEYGIENKLNRELYRFQNKLPIFAKRLEIEKHIENPLSRFLIIQGQTGSGKSTQIPQYFADHPKFDRKKILCTQPRKIAAISLAKRVAFEYRCGDPKAKPGYQVGFCVAGNKAVSFRTRIEFITEGKMLEIILSGKKDPFMNVGCIILDETHERSVTCDLLMGCFKSEDPRWKDIMIVLTSATIDLDYFSQFFNNAPCVLAEGRTYPVEVKYDPTPGFGADNAEFLAFSVSRALEIHSLQASVPGDILCFLPGQSDVLAAKELFEAKFNSISDAEKEKMLKPHVLPLYGKMEPEDQSKVFEVLSPGIRKIIFATDIAETSITIDGVVHVVDSGVKKGIVYDAKRKISSLRLQEISKSSAIQRAGRAGRTQPGECYRLYRKEDFETMEFSSTPEILRRPLGIAVLTLRKLGINPKEFSWISNPPMDSMIAAEEELLLLGALAPSTGHGETILTELGDLISQVQQEPSIVKMIYNGCQQGFGEAAITVASILTVSSIFFWNGGDSKSKAESMEKRNRFALIDGDVVSLFRAFEEWLGATRLGLEPNKGGNWCRSNFVNGKAMKLIMSTRKELQIYFSKTKPWLQHEKGQLNKPTNEELSRIAFSGLFSNTSRLLKMKNTRKLQYYSLHTGVVGTCSFSSAIARHPNPPEWIIYDRVLQVPTTLFLICNRVTENWIEEENKDFYKICKEKSSDLPTSIVKYISQEVLITLAGKFFSNMHALEIELNGSIEVGIDSGHLALFCPRNRISKAEKLLNERIKSVVTQLEDRVIEQDYLGGLRLLLGKGYKVQGLLFMEEFLTVFVRNLPLFFSETDLRKAISHVMEDNDEGINQIQLLHQQKFTTAIVTFHKKEAALAFHQKFHQVTVNDRSLKIYTNPSLSRHKGVFQEIIGKLKFSWAVAQSTQKAKIWFRNGSDANRFIEYAGTFLSNAIIHGVDGCNDYSSTRPLRSGKGNANPKNKPPLLKISAPKSVPMSARFRFDIDRINLMPENLRRDFEYAVHVKNIPLRMDEYEIMEALSHLNVTYVRVLRHQESHNASAVDSESLKVEMLLPVMDLLKNTSQQSEFHDKIAQRAGINFYFKRVGLLRDVYRKIVSSERWREMRKPYGQPGRLEMEYIYTASIHNELYMVLEKNIGKILEYAKTNNINVMPSKKENSISRFTFLRFQATTERQFPEIRLRLEEVISCTKFRSEQIHLLFTFTGNQKLEQFPFKQYLFSSYQSQSIWIYGPAELRQDIVTELEKVVQKIKSFDILDHPITLNKKLLNVTKFPQDREKVLRICAKVNSLESFLLKGSKLYVSGPNESVEKVTNLLSAQKFIFTPFPSRKQERLIQECGICFTPPDEAYVITTSCDAKCSGIFCLECIRPMFDLQPPPFPLNCPSCQFPFVINDILKWASPKSLQKVMEMAVRDYKEKNTDSILSCPKPGCDQLLAAASLAKGDNGGEFIFCDECRTTYCLPCSKKLNKPVEMHEDDSCEDIQNGTASLVIVHVKKIREKILNLCCPKCGTAFLDFDGCGALNCSLATCKCAFCALCLKDCGMDAHSHVINCELNREKSFYISKDNLTHAHKTIRIEKLKEYFKKVSDQEREKVLQNLCKDLLDLGIALGNLE